MHPNLHIHKKSNFLEIFGFYNNTVSRGEREQEGTGKRAFGRSEEGSFRNADI